MSKYKISESVGNTRQDVHSYEDLEIHHPSANARGLRSGRAEDFQSPTTRRHERIDGEFEEVRHTRDGGLLVEKDFILTHDARGPVNVPAPISGYVHYTHDKTATVQIFEQANGQGRLLAQVLHMEPDSFTLREGARVEYGQPLGAQGDTGSPRSIHCHVEVNVDQFKKYIGDIANGTITPNSYPAIGSVQAAPAATIQPNPLADGVLRQGERGPEITALQTRLNALGFKDDRGNALATDGDFGNSTKQAVAAFQRARDLEDDGVVGKDTLAALKQPSPTVQMPQPSAPPRIQASAATSALSNLIGSGEGDYNSYNRGSAGDAGSAINLTDMTVGEIIRRQHLSKSDPEYLFAVGKFQLVGPPADTMSETVRALGIPQHAKFTPDLQERMFADYLIDGKRPAVNEYITGKTNGTAGLERAQHALALEFASVGDPRKGGRGAYDGDSAGNSASISLLESASALNMMRAQYQAGIDRGLSPEAAYDSLRGQAPNQSNALSIKNNALADGVLKKGEHGPEIAVLQTQLNALGFKDAHGRALIPDGDFGERTKQAVEAFQRSRDLEADGVVNKDTLAALKKAVTPDVSPTSQQHAPAKNDQAPLLSNPNHPDHALYKQALAGIEKLPSNTFKNDHERQNAAASVAFEAKVSGLTRVDTVALSLNGSGLFAVQGAMSDPAHHRVYVDKNQAAAQTVEKSSQQLQQESLLSVQAVQAQEHHRKSLVV